jgi:dTDP-4-amino-4,6-dideoxygalactose transaminase
VNSRLDTLQAAILSEKLAIFEEEIAARNRVAERYAQGLAGVVKTPSVPQGLVSVWAQYTVRVKHRNAFAENMKRLGVPTAIYYATPLHEQTGYRGFPVPKAGLPVSNVLAQDVISLPMHPYLDEQTQDRIIEAVKASCTGDL